MIKEIVNTIKANAKRMKKLETLTTRQARMQAEKYVRAECLARKIKLSDDEIRRATILVVG